MRISPSSSGVASIRCRLGVCCVVALLTVVSGVRAAETADADQVIAEFLDLNGDHRISYDEFVKSVAAKAIRDMDANKDGSLSRAEVAAPGVMPDVKGQASLPAFDFSKADANGDGRVSLDELKQAIGGSADVQALFQKLDKDGDGYLNESELKSLQGVPLIELRF